MQIIIGGSPSTGSSLLRQMLNRHSAIYCGPETKLFAFPDLYDRWDNLKSGLIKRPFLVAPDVHLVKGANLSGAEQKWSAVDVGDLINSSGSLKEFASGYFQKPCYEYGKRYWAEKTPANVLGFREFHRHFETPVIIHIVRDPMDTIASLINRGLPLFQAVSRYLFSTTYGLSASDLNGYVEVRYEQLVSSPEKALKDFFDMSGLKFESEMLSKGNPAMTETHKMAGWTHSETDLPAKSAVGRFNLLTEKQQDEILQAAACLSINGKFALKNDLRVVDIAAIATELNYQLPGNLKASHGMRRRLKMSRLSRMMFSLAERSTFFVRQRPIEVR